jgi:hypothetical protein
VSCLLLRAMPFAADVPCCPDLSPRVRLLAGISRWQPGCCDLDVMCGGSSPLRAAHPFLQEEGQREETQRLVPQARSMKVLVLYCTAETKHTLSPSSSHGSGSGSEWPLLPPAFTLLLPGQSGDQVSAVHRCNHEPPSMLLRHGTCRSLVPTTE